MLRRLVCVASGAVRRFDFKGNPSDTKELFGLVGESSGFVLLEPELPVDAVALIGPGGILEGVSICPTSDEGGWIESSGIDNLLVSTRNGGAIKVPSSDSSDIAASGIFA